jgi:excisionase family DNA binding protein
MTVGISKLRGGRIKNMTELMTPDETASYLRVTKKTIYRLAQLSRIPAVKVGQQWRFRKTELDEWLHRTSTGTTANILVIDDEEIIRSLFRETLEDSGHKVTTAATGSKGVELVRQRDFDLVFLDLKMPGTDGAEVLRQIKSIKPDLPVAIITGYPNSDTMARALAQGPLGVMNKPFSEADIASVVANFLHITRKR